MARFYKIDDINKIDLNKLLKLLPGASMWNPLSTQSRYVMAILRSYNILNKYEINTPLRIAHFLGQGLIETGFLRYAAENLNYSASRLRVIFPKYVKSDEQAQKLHRKPEQIANLVYSGRLGNTEPGDGWKYRGRGFFQLTGRANYRRFGEIAGIDLEGNPDLIEKDLTKSVEVAAAYFAHMKLGKYADQNDGSAVSRGVNLGNPNSSVRAHGESDRILWAQNALALFANPEKILEESGVESGASNSLQLGSSGPAVQELQEDLNQLGYPAGRADGIFGRKTSQALVLFQHDNNLAPTGIANEETLQRLEEAIANNDRGNVDIYRDAETDSEVRRKTGAGNGAASGGAVAGTIGGAGAANEAGVLDEVVEAGKEMLDDLTERVEGEDPEAGDGDTTSETDTSEDDSASDTTDETTTETNTETGTPPVTPDSTKEEGGISLALILFIALIVIGLFIFLRARANNKRRMDDYRNGNI